MARTKARKFVALSTIRDEMGSEFGGVFEATLCQVAPHWGRFVGDIEAYFYYPNHRLHQSLSAAISNTPRWVVLTYNRNGQILIPLFARNIPIFVILIRKLGAVKEASYYLTGAEKMWSWKEIICSDIRSSNYDNFFQTAWFCSGKYPKRLQDNP